MNKKFLTDLAEHHNEWVNVVRKFGEDLYAEDIVQEMYLKLSAHEDTEKFYRNGKLYKGFIWIILRNMFLYSQKIKLRLKKVSINEIFELKDETEAKEKTTARLILELKTNATIDSWHWYDKMLFNLYKDSGLSYRQIEKETGISFKSAWSTIDNCKKLLKQELAECYEDYANEDYELIK